MVTTICPHCGHNAVWDVVIAGFVKGAVIAGLATYFKQPKLGAAALTGLAAKAWLDSGKTEIKCPKCQWHYHT